MPLIQGTNQWYEEVRIMAQGLVVNQPPEVSESGTTRDADWFYEVDDELRQAPGRLHRYTFEGGPVRGMFEWIRKDGVKVSIAHVGKDVWRSTDGIQWSRLFTHDIETKNIVTYDVVTPDDILLWADGVNPVMQCHPVTSEVIPLPMPVGVTNARIVRHFKARTILIDVVELGNRVGYRVWWSQPLVYDGWDSTEGANFVDYGDGGGPVVMALIFNDTLVLLKEMRIGVLNHTAQTLDVPFRLADYAQLPGTMYPFSALVTPRGILYTTHDGVRQFDGERTILVTGKVGMQLTRINTLSQEQVVATWDSMRLRYLLSVATPGSPVNDRLWEVRFDESELSLLLRKATVYKRKQSVSMLYYMHYDRPHHFNNLNCRFSDIGVSFDDPTVISCQPTLMSGDVDGNIYAHEVTSNPDSLPYVELGPFPKDPLPSAHTSKKLGVIRLRGRKRYNGRVRVLVRPLHRPNWTELRTLDFGAYNDRETIEVSGEGIEGEQFFVRFERVSGQPQLVNFLMTGTVIQTLRRTRAA